HALGFPNGPVEPRLTVSSEARDAGRRVLIGEGWDGQTPLVALAPGAAYGAAKKWPSASFAELAGALASDGVQCVMVGSAADVETAADVARATGSVARPFHPSTSSGCPEPAEGQGRDVGGPERPALQIMDLAGRTDLVTLAGVFAHCRALVTNDLGAMHVGAAVGIAVTVVFGPTNEHETRPMGDAHRVLSNPVWCRPCMLRECPLDHRCMRGIGVASVLAAARRTL
ncbi:MAG: glycosyltransferase family 9 protein, partial [Acidobacteria bacterium]|nr:glycosyltransferase family 9 protein [Acidobacteriota bacterium]